MAEYLSPGVYIEEIDNSPRSIEGVGTSTAGFIGLAAKGQAIGAPVLITGFSEYLRNFGTYLPEHVFGDFRYLTYSVEQFFANGGTRCYVSRVVPEDAVTAEYKAGPLTITAANEGKWGNRIALTFATANRRKMQLLSGEGQIFEAKNVDGFAEGDMVECLGEVNRIAMIVDKTVTFEKAFSASPVDDAMFPKTLIYSVEMDVTVSYEGEVENYTGVSFNDNSPNHIAKRLKGSNIVTITSEACDEIANPVSIVLGEGKITGNLLLTGGSDGSVANVNAGTFLGTDNGPGRRTGIESFKENTDASIIAVPGVTIPEVVVGLVAHCEREKNRFAVLDLPKECVKVNEVLKCREIVDSTYAAMYHPWISVFDRVTQKNSFIPPSGAVMGVYSRTDISRGVHKAPANETVVTTGLSVNYTASEQDLINPAGINLIRILPGQGIRVWGARTASSNSAFKYVNVRRLFIFVEQSIKAATNWVVFEPNNTALWARVQMTISSFLDTLYRAGMLSGTTASEAYFVEIGTSTMTRDDILNGRLICNIGIAPSRPAEFVIFKISQLTSEAESAE